MFIRIDERLSNKQVTTNMSTTWYYYSKGQKHGPVSGGQLKGLAKNGKITPETVIETESGKIAQAGKVKGLTFGEAASSDESAPFRFPCPNCKNTLQAKKKLAGKTKSCPTCGEPFTVPTAVPAPPSETETYGLSQVKPSPEPSPFTASLSEAVSKPVATPPETANPFTDSMPVITMPTDNPFTATMSAASRAMPQSVPVPAADNEEYKSPSSPVPIFVGLGVLLLVLLVIGITVLNSSSVLVGRWGDFDIGGGPGSSVTIGSIPFRLELFKDGTGSADGRAVTWKATGGRLYLTDSRTSTVGSWKYKTSGSRLTLFNDEGQSLIFKRGK